MTKKILVLCSVFIMLLGLCSCSDILRNMKSEFYVIWEPPITDEEKEEYIKKAYEYLEEERGVTDAVYNDDRISFDFFVGNVNGPTKESAEKDRDKWQYRVMLKTEHVTYYVYLKYETMELNLLSYDRIEKEYQYELLTNKIDEWKNADDSSRYAVTDLDKDGYFEIICLVLNSSGLYQYDIYELTPEEEIIRFDSSKLNDVDVCLDISDVDNSFYYNYYEGYNILITPSSELDFIYSVRLDGENNLVETEVINKSKLDSYVEKDLENFKLKDVKILWFEILDIEDVEDEIAKSYSTFEESVK